MISVAGMAESSSQGSRISAGSRGVRGLLRSRPPVPYREGPLAYEPAVCVCATERHHGGFRGVMIILVVGTTDAAEQG